MSRIRLLVGLGNPGPEYSQTRHNAGFWLVEQFARSHGQQLQPDSKFFGNTTRIQQGALDLRVLQPMQFMNRSGNAVALLAHFYKILPEEILVAYDELDLPAGVAKFKTGGGTGGHNGIKDIVARLGSQNFHRLRIGIGHPGDKSKVTGWVLGKAPAHEQQLMDDTITEACRSIDLLLQQDMRAAQQHLHSFKAQREK
ncbi:MULTISPECIES: aminoacyl-tRNA hydrolase [Idiomarinaceae]|uniref:Peptidyl-tRNA hydrolase n=1 Tax=Pseudidiomarina fusca TaxID=2965078 RepID=A0ABU3KUI1_9GAMM|nr:MULTISPECIES: aminoacyl-tRNA hydrolase [Idiomarinaceae]MDT7525144.1 aminoacyl-tRNA hydrolase [Pseudidiomarina sp. GXY010]MRJ41007.1 aminoacyl-tRNA hydrolase [Idiomarina sp. FeN1]NCU56172.1 aminoacyl-tRNA hydrolase [Idiomarina sp. FenA--70]NCU59191.1 aminoacyl-tRNA hydrolase [Idiomarina sp. FenBw--71]UUN14864.1 aminoacyl-tRNA hydrolase [Idiomarina loihiensis]